MALFGGARCDSEAVQANWRLWLDELGCECDGFGAAGAGFGDGPADIPAQVERAIASGVRYRMFTFRPDAATDAKAADSAFRRAVARLRETRPYVPVALLAPDETWLATAGELDVLPSGDWEPHGGLAPLYAALVRGWSVGAVRGREAAAARRTQRLYEAKWGVFNHFLGHGCKTAAEWNAKVERLDVRRIADQLEACGARFYFFTVMQGRRWMCAPSRTFDEIAGTKPGEACSVRDLPLELAAELGKRGIDLYLYFTGDGPYLDPEIGPRFSLPEKATVFCQITEPFVRKWATVLAELAARYGSAVKGWWFDGCYDDIRGYTPELLGLYAEAARAGNPDALVAMNNGVFPAHTKYWPEEDFTAGEFNDFFCVPERRFIDGAQAFQLAPLGLRDGEQAGWGRSGCKRSADYMARFVPLVNENGGVVCIDVRVNPDGSWDPDQMAVLKAVGKATETLKHD